MLVLPKPRCIAIDFDFTLTFFAGGFDGLLDIFVKRGVSRAHAHQAWQLAEEEGFSLAVYQQFVRRVCGEWFRTEEIEPDFEAWLKKTLVLYPEVRRVVSKWHEQRIPLVVVTRGNKGYQKSKVTSVGLPFTACHVMTESFTKHTVVAQLLEKYGAPVLFIEDRAKELDGCRRLDPTGQQIHTVWLQRGDSPYDEQAGEFEHPVIHCLAELSFAKTSDSGTP